MGGFRGPGGGGCSPSGFDPSSAFGFNDAHTCYFETYAFDAGWAAKGAQGAVEEDGGTPADGAEEGAIEEFSETEGWKVWVGCGVQADFNFGGQD